MNPPLPQKHLKLLLLLRQNLDGALMNYNLRIFCLKIGQKIYKAICEGDKENKYENPGNLSLLPRQRRRPSM